MKKTLLATSLLLHTVIFNPFNSAHGQNIKDKKIGKASSFIKELKEEDKSEDKKDVKKKIKLDTPEGLIIEVGKFAPVDTTPGFDKSKEKYSGYIGNEKTSNVDFTIDNGTVSGTIVIQNKKKAYKIITKNDGEIYLRETSIDSIICVGIAKTTATGATAATAATVIPQLESRPGAPVVVYLDFDGEYVISRYWNGGNPIDAAPSGFSEQEIYLTWSIMSEDYAPYNVNVTTKRNLYDQKPYGSKNMCIFTPTTTAAPGWGGVAQIGSIISTDFAPCWAFNAGGKAAGETGSHEVGHVMNLTHDGYFPTDQNADGSYYWGHSNNLWGPIMGAAFSPKIVQWSKGEYQTANNQQDDLAIIGSSRNKFGFVTDEAGADLGTSKYLAYNSTGVLDSNGNAGVISKTSDVDIYKFKTNGGSINIKLQLANSITTSDGTYTVTNLDAKLELLNSSGTVIASSDPAEVARPSIARSLAAGTYYLRIDGVGYLNPATDGYSDYGSLGRYKVSGTIQGATANDFYISIVSPETNSIIVDPATITITPSIKSTPNGITKVEYFEGTVKLGEATASPNFTFSKNNFTEGTHTIYAKAINSAGQTINSSTISFTVYRSIVGETAGNFYYGINYDYYEGTFTALPNFTTLTPVYRGISNLISGLNDPYYVPRTRTDNFAIRFKGYVNIYEDGLYRFNLTSDDGAKFYLGGKLLINNDGVHTATTKFVTVALKAGFIPVEVQYFEGTGPEQLTLTSFNLETGLENYLSYSRKDNLLIYPDFVQQQLVAGVKYEYNEGDYNLLPTNFNALTYKSTGGISNFSLTIPNRRADYFAVRYTSYIELPHDGEWVFYLNSDEGTKLYINDVLLINNDGIHTATTEKIGKSYLAAGKHKIKVEYFEKTGTEALSLSFSGPNTLKQTIPASLLTRETVRGEVMPYFGVALQIPSTLEAEYYDQGGEGFSYHDLTIGNQFNYFRNEDVDINKVVNIDNYESPVVSGIQAGEWLNYTINSTGSGRYDLFFVVGSGSSTSSLLITSSGTGTSYTVPVPAITNGTAWQIVILRNALIGTGEHVVKITFNGTFNFDRLEVYEPGTARLSSNDNLDATTLAFNVNVYPNPFDAKINMDLSNFTQVESIKIIDARGSIFWEASSADLSKKIITYEENIPEGFYFVEIKADGNIFNSKIVKTH